jgi:hypothetical protein
MQRSGPEGRASLACFQEVRRLRKNSERKANPAQDGLAGAESRIILLTLSARLKSGPDSFFDSAEFFIEL